MLNSIIVTFLAYGIAVSASYNIFGNQIGDRIVGGEKARIEDFPYQVAIQGFSPRKEWKFHCGGCIIRANVVLTAAHCMNYPHWRYLVVAGTTFWNKGGVVRNVSKIIIHDQYDRAEPIGFDIALIFIHHGFPFTNTIQSIALPTLDLPDGAFGVVSGWGKTACADLSTNLQKVEVPIVNQRICSEMYGAINYQITSTMLCAGLVNVGGKDACSGDSGGAFVRDNVLYGIVSMGKGCASGYFPGVYTRITAVVPWIQYQVEQELFQMYL